MAVGRAGHLVLARSATGTAGIVSCFDAAAGLLYAVTATAPAGHRGYHPAGTSDASGFAAMGVAEAVLHGFDILAAQGIGYRRDEVVVFWVSARIFPAAGRHRAIPGRTC